MYHHLKTYLTLTFFLTLVCSFAQQRQGPPRQGPAAAKISITGTVIEKISKQPLE